MNKNDPIILRNNTPEKNSNTGRSRGKGFLTIALVLVLIISAITGMGIRFLYNMYETLPSPAELQNIQPPLVSKVFADDGSLVHEFSIERRFWVPLNKMPQNLQRAVVAIEDRRFYKHWGIDLRRIIGAALVNVVRGGYSQGASTLTQQLARNVYLSMRSSLIRKVREAMTATQIESYYTKQEILELYLNQVYLGAGVYGMEAASQRYFSKSVDSLSLNECALLAGLIQLPEYYRPDKPENIKRITKRRKSVLAAMRDLEYITPEQEQAINADSIPVNPKKKVAKVAPYFMEMVRNHVERKYGEDLLYNGGLEIYTTLDPVAQDSAENAVKWHLDSLQKWTNRIFLDSTKAYASLKMSRDSFMVHFDSLYEAQRDKYDALPDSVRLRIVQGSVVAIDVATGGIKVLIGGRNFSESKFNRALQARRQPGSSIKPIVYTVGIDSGLTPASVLIDQPITLETPDGLWRPENYEKEFQGAMPLRKALNKSVNLIAIQVLQKVGAGTVVSYARKMGLRHRMNPVPSLAIGACEVTPIEMASAYSIYPRGGKKVEPYYIERIVDKNGRVLEEHSSEEEDVLSPQTSFIMCSLLKSVVTNGTGASIPRRGFTRPAGGKTGTTNDYSDAWFVGFTPQIACAVWVGVDERRGMGRGATGSRCAIPIWVGAMSALHRALPVEKFVQPEGIVKKRICSVSYKLPTRYCPSYFEEYFVEGNLPDTCTEHSYRGSHTDGSVLQRFGTAKKSADKKQKKRRSNLMF